VELSKAFHAFGAQSNTSSITRATWVSANGTYVIATDLKSHSHKSKLRESGINAWSINTYIIGQFSKTTKAMKSKRSLIMMGSP
jgi:hypothetical protein